jgi:hypothetical protein
MSTAINWQVLPNDPVLKHPLYLKYSGSTFSAVDALQVKADLVKALASNESAPVIEYLCWLLRVIALVSG